MAKYSIEVSATAEKQIRSLGSKDQVRVLRAIQHLAADPYPPGTRKLRGYTDVYRIRIGTFRVIYSVESKRLLVIILKVGHRKNIYR